MTPGAQGLRVLGNEDCVLWEVNGPDPNHPSLEYTRYRPTVEQVAWLRAAPREATWQRVRFFHGRPGRDDHYLLEVVEPEGLRAATATEARANLAAIDADVVLCGHSHIPRILRLDDGRLVVNPGSVGLQAYTDALPWPHVVAGGDPLARYARLVKTGGRWLPTLHAVRYDWTAASREARRNGRPDWAQVLETGLAAPRFTLEGPS